MTFLPHTSPKILAVAKAMAAFFESSETKISIKSILKIIKASYLVGKNIELRRLSKAEAKPFKAAYTD